LTSDTYAVLNIRGANHNVTGDLARIKMDLLSDEIMDVGAQVVWWGVLTAQARRRVDELKYAMEILRAEIAEQFRSVEASLGHKTTVDQVNDRVNTDERMREAKAAYFAAEEAASIAESTKYALVGKQGTLEKLTGQLPPPAPKNSVPYPPARRTSFSS